MKKTFLKFEEARAYVRALRLKGKRQWKEYSKTTRPSFIPSNPWMTYKDKWVSHQDWMGYEWGKADSKKFIVNEDFFKVWSPDMAYVLGFWFADGYIYNGLARGKRTRFIFGISQCEKLILEQISKAMGSTYPIHEEVKKVGATSYRFFIESKKIVDDIIALGGEYRKSLKLKFPKIPKEFLPHFIRGLWDGDGSAFFFRKKESKIRKSSVSPSASFSCGSEKFVFEFNKILKDIGIRNPNIVQDKRRKSAFNICLSPNDSRRLRDYIYKSGDLFIKRKKDMFFTFGNIVASSGADFVDYITAKKFAVSLGINKSREWHCFSKAGGRPYNIPSNPNKTYKNCGWNGWTEFLTKKKGV